MKFEPVIVSAITALVAVIVSPIASIYIARRQESIPKLVEN